MESETISERFGHSGLGTQHTLTKCPFGHLIDRIKAVTNQNSKKATSQESLKQYTLAQVSEHCDSTSCWLAILDKVYDVTEFLIKHPGGEEIILENAGLDATVPFTSKGHSKEAFLTLDEYCIGDLVEKDRRNKKSQP